MTTARTARESAESLQTQTVTARTARESAESLQTQTVTMRTARESVETFQAQTVTMRTARESVEVLVPLLVVWPTTASFNVTVTQTVVSKAVHKAVGSFTVTATLSPTIAKATRRTTGAFTVTLTFGPDTGIRNAAGAVRMGLSVNMSARATVKGQWFQPPTVDDVPPIIGGPHPWPTGPAEFRLFSHYKNRARGRTVLLLKDHVVNCVIVDNPAQMVPSSPSEGSMFSEIGIGGYRYTEIDRVFLGGHIHRINSDEATRLTAFGLGAGISMEEI